MNTTHTRKSTLNILSFLAICSLVLSPVPIAQAAGETLSIKASDVKTQYVVGQSISMKVTIPEKAQQGGIVVHLSAVLGGEFSGGNLDGGCTGSFSSTLNLTIASSTAQKAFCFKPTTVGAETVNAFFVVTEVSMGINLPVVDVAPTICPPGTAGVFPVCTEIPPSPVVIDVCPNIPDEQAVIPKDMIIDGESCVFEEEEFDTYRIEGYVWHDSDRNQEWEDFGEDNRDGGDERGLSDWSVTIADGKQVYNTTTDATGAYFFEVPAGTWTITIVMERGWRRTTEQAYVVTVPDSSEAEPSLASLIKEFIIPTAHAAVVGTYGPYNFGIVKTSSGGTRVAHRAVAPTQQVLGTSTTTEKFVFNNDLRLGSSHPDVMELQKRLRAEGFFNFPTDTGYFGPVTLAAVKAYQTAHPEIGYVTGFCGPLTRGVLNK